MYYAGKFLLHTSMLERKQETSIFRIKTETSEKMAKSQTDTNPINIV